MVARLTGAMDPIVLHSLIQYGRGEPLLSVLHRTALMGALVGAGHSPGHALQLVEHAEAARAVVPGSEPAQPWGSTQGAPWATLGELVPYG